MKLVAIHLWKEWREHRAALGFLALALPLVIACPAFTMSPRLVATPTFALGAVLVAVLAVLLVVGGELLGYEARGPGPRWLERLPRALGGAFAAKGLFFAATTVGAALFGLGAAVVLTRLRGEVPRLRSESEAPYWLGLAGLVALWTFAASSCARRGGLALLGGSSLFVVSALPAEIFSRNWYVPSSWEVAVFLALMIGAPLFGAWYGFTVRGQGVSSCRGIVTTGLATAAVVGLVPWSWLGYRWHARSHVDPESVGFVLDGVEVSLDGRWAFLLGRDDLAPWSTPSACFRVDLTTGVTEQIGADVGFWTYYRGGECSEYAVIENGDVRSFDARNGQPLVPEPVEAAENDSYELRRAGLGWIARSWDDPYDALDAEIHDPFSHQTYSFGELFPGRDIGNTLLGLLVLPKWWLVEDEEELAWSWFDPGSGLRAATGWPAAWDNKIVPAAVLPDGRLLLEEVCELEDGDRASLKGMGWQLLDPASGELQTVTLDGVPFEWSLDNAYAPGEWNATVFDRGPALLLEGYDVAYQLDPQTGALHPIAATPDEHFVRSFADGTVILIDTEHRLVRLQLESGEREVLFPREQGAQP